MLSNNEENINTSINLGIIAGEGLLPSEIASLHQKLGGKVFIAALEGEADIFPITSYSYKQFPIGSVGALLEYFVENTFNYPTLAEAYKIAALDVWNRMPRAK